MKIGSIPDHSARMYPCKRSIGRFTTASVISGSHHRNYRKSLQSAVTSNPDLFRMNANAAPNIAPFVCISCMFNDLQRRLTMASRPASSKLMFYLILALHVLWRPSLSGHIELSITRDIDGDLGAFDSRKLEECRNIA